MGSKSLLDARWYPLAFVRERLIVTHSVFLHWELQENTSVLATRARRWKPNLSFPMRASRPLKKFQMYSESITFSCMMLCPTGSSWSGNRTRGSNSTFLEVLDPSQKCWHGPARPVDRSTLASEERNAVRSLEQSEQGTRVSYLHRCEHMDIYFTSWNCSCVYINKHTFISIHPLIHLVRIYWASARNQLPVIPWWVETPCVLLRDFLSGGWGCSVCACVLSRFGRVQLCDPRGCSPPGSSVHGILQAKILGLVAISFSRGSSQPRDQTQISYIVDRHFTVWATREVQIGIKQTLNANLWFKQD